MRPLLAAAGLATAFFLPLCPTRGDEAPWTAGSDFERAFRDVPASAAPSHIGGQLAAPFRDDSTWADLDVAYSRETDRPGAGKAAQRIELKAVRQGYLIVGVDHVPLDAHHFTKVSLAMLAPGGLHLTLVLRKTGYPWTSYWEQPVYATPEWQTYQFLVPPMGTDPDAKFTLVLKDPGTLLVDDFSLAAIDEEQMASHEKPREGNLLPASSFPDGLHGQWCLAPGGYFGWGLSRAVPCPEVPGPTSVASLKIGVGGPTAEDQPWPSRLVSPPFRLLSGRVHTVSFYAKGTPGRVVTASLGDPQVVKIPGDKRPGFQKTFVLGADWQRFSFSQQVPYGLTGTAVLNLQADSPCWIDGLEVEEADHAGPFARPGAAEVSLRPGRLSGLSFDDEPLSYAAAVYGKMEKGMQLIGTVTDPRGRTTPLDPVELTADGLQKIPRALPAGQAALLGPYRLELAVANARGNRVSPPEQLLLHRLHHPRMEGRDAPDSMFGIHIYAHPDTAETMKALGFNWVRTHDVGVTDWYFLEKKPGVFDFADADREVEALRSRHLMVLGMLDTFPAFYGNRPADWDPNLNAAMYFLPRPENLDHWKDYCARVMARYKGRIDDWEVLNESYASPGYFIRAASPKMELGTPEDYAGLFRLAREARQEANPDARLTWLMSVGSGWNDRCIAAGILADADQLSIHTYAGKDNALGGFPDTLLARIFTNRLRPDLALAPAGSAKPFAIWNTEGSAPNIQVPWTTNPAYAEGGCEAQANQLLRFYLALYAQGVKKWFAYTGHVWGLWRPFFYIVQAPDGSLAPSADAFSEFAWLVEGKALAETRPLGGEAFAFCFTGANDSVIVLAANSPQSRALATIPAGWTLLDVNGNPAPGTAGLDAERVAYLFGPGKDRAAALRDLAALALQPPPFVP